MSYLFTSESVSEGHPDKVCDQISDAVLDLFLSRDKTARAAVETLATTNRIILAAKPPAANISRRKRSPTPSAKPSEKSAMTRKISAGRLSKSKTCFTTSHRTLPPV